ALIWIRATSLHIVDLPIILTEMATSQSMILFGARLALSLTVTSPEKPGIATLHPLSGGDDLDAGLFTLG
ncbi:MAG: hypothetical protein ACRC8B_07625, partial [Aeromonas sobria]|uniref:hypothetical protein n=1 Tax=Aeromonas sobria TaxID=646 RepID=UPI003F3D8871